MDRLNYTMEGMMEGIEETVNLNMEQQKLYSLHNRKKYVKK